MTEQDRDRLAYATARAVEALLFNETSKVGTGQGHRALNAAGPPLRDQLARIALEFSRAE